MPSTPDWLKKSFTVPMIKAVIKFFSKLSLYHHIEKHFWGKDSKVPPGIAEAYVWASAFLITVALFVMPYIYFTANVIIVILASYRLFDMLVNVARMIFIESSTTHDQKGQYIIVEARNVERWIILNIVNIYEIIMCFSVIFLFWGKDFCDDINSPLTAIYQSFLTLTTLGYGEIHADGNISKLLVILQLAYFIVFILLVAPLVFSSIRAKPGPDPVKDK